MRRDYREQMINLKFASLSELTRFDVTKGAGRSISSGAASRCRSGSGLVTSVNHPVKVYENRVGDGKSSDACNLRAAFILRATS